MDPSRLEAHVRKLSIELGPRDMDHIENLDRVAAYIKDELSQTTAHVSEQIYPVQGQTYRNVVAHFGPESVERIIVGAHYHTAEDTADKLDYKRMAMVVEGVYAAVMVAR